MAFSKILHNLCLVYIFSVEEVATNISYFTGQRKLNCKEHKEHADFF